MLFKISPLSFHTRVTCTETASPLFDSYSDRYMYVCGPALPTPKLAAVSTRQYSLCVSGTLSLARYSRQNSQQGFFKVRWVQRPLSQVVWNPVTVRTARNGLTDVMCYVTSGTVKASVPHTGGGYAKIRPKQGGSKIVKISQQMAKLCQKLQWLLFF